MQYTRRVAVNNLMAADEGIALSVRCIKEELDTMDIKNLRTNDFADLLKTTFAGGYPAEAVEIVHGFVYTEFGPLAKAVITKEEVSSFIGGALEARAEMDSQFIHPTAKIG